MLAEQPAQLGGPVWIVRGHRLSKLLMFRWLSAVLFAAMAILVILLFSPDFRGPPSPPTSEAAGPGASAAAGAELQVCHLAGCVEQAAQAVAYMNRSVDPCQDFFHYACGRFDEVHPTEVLRGFGVAEVVQERNRHHLMSLLRREEFFNKTSAASKARTFFTSCTVNYQYNSNFVASLVALLDEFGGLDLFGTWKPARWDFNRVYREASAAHLMEALFELRWRPDTNELRMVLPTLAIDARLGLQQDVDKYNKVLNTLRQSLRTALQLLERDARVVERNVTRTCGRSCVDELADDVVAMEAAIDDVKPVLPHKYSAALSRISLASLQTMADQVDWRRLLDALYGEGSVPDTVHVVLPSAEFATGVGRIIASTPVKRMHHYLMWSLIRRYLVALGPTYSVLDQDFRHKFNEQLFKTREEQCLEIVSEYMTPAVHAIFVSGYIGKQTLEQVTGLVGDLFREVNDSFGWMTDASRNRSRDFLSKLHVRYGSSDLVTDPRKLDDHYRNLTITRQNFFENLKAVYGFGTPGQITRGFASEPTASTPADVRITYDLRRNSLNIPYAMLQVPWYHPDLPRHLSVASFGSLMFAGLAMPLLFIHRLSSLEDLWDTETAGRYDQFHDCTLEELSRTQTVQHSYQAYVQGDELYVAPRKFTIDPANSMLHVVSQYLGYHLSHRLYKKLQSKAPHVVLPGMQNISSERAFFLAFAHSRCSNDFMYWGALRRESFIRVPESAVINRLVNGDPTFREAFGCAPVPAEVAAKQCSLLRWP
ncbi:endothelin-converting enzyme-like 1 [Pollicipes pollicipes]|uniref:endothelin-converting enzyme-like 1 n=1 Tax=Pollicipes pollicipes TaxID=41117 RepID=UPI001884CAD5|nr:endothelin-converting enzyme-like 1 [Pollicipes pollicipes]